MDKKYTLLQTAQFTGTNVATIRSWYQRGPFRIGLEGMETDDVSPQSSGHSRLLAINTVYAIGITAALTALGVDLARAARVALSFAHTSRVDNFFGVSQIPNQPSRLPSRVYDGIAKTVIMIAANGDIDGKIAIVASDTTIDKWFWI